MSTTPKPLHVVGYPKSGNTYLSRLLADYLQCNISASASDEINGVDNRTCKLGSDEWLIFKEHLRPTHISSEHVVVIVRDPRPVMESSYFHHNRWAQRLVCRSKYWGVVVLPHLILNCLFQNISWGGNFLQRLRGGFASEVGSWSSFYGEWISSGNFAILRYEDLLADPELQLERIIKQLQLQEYCKKSLADVIEAQRLERRLQEFESKDDAVNLQFLQRPKEIMPTWLRGLISARHRQMMCYFRYI